MPSTCPSNSDIDLIRIYDGSTGKFVDQINLDAYAKTVGQTRATAQALLFGPSGKLFVPITLRPALTGQVVVCDIKTCNGFTGVGALGVPFYLTFGELNSLACLSQLVERGNQNTREIRPRTRARDGTLPAAPGACQMRGDGRLTAQAKGQARHLH